MSLLNRKFLFVHINKSGGGVITNHMSNNGNTTITGKHRSLTQMLNLAKQNYGLKVDDLYIFTIVRNPWARMLSMYLFYHPNNYNAPEFFSGKAEIDNNFNNWIKWIYSPDFNITRKHGVINIKKFCFSNQLNWISNSKGDIYPNVKIIRFENIKNELEDLFKNVMKLEKINLETKIHPTKHKHYSEYYNNETKNLVADHYSKDIEYFNYTF